MVGVWASGTRCVLHYVIAPVVGETVQAAAAEQLPAVHPERPEFLGITNLELVSLATGLHARRHLGATSPGSRT